MKPNSLLLLCCLLSSTLLFTACKKQLNEPATATDANMLASGVQARLSTNGIAGYDMRDGNDLGIAFDYTGTGKPDHLLLYRPGVGFIQIIRKTNGVFNAVYSSGNGIGGFDLKGLDRIIAFDYNSSGKMDHLLLYRRMSGRVMILKNTNGVFTQVYNSPSGIGGYPVIEPRDEVIAFDYNGTGKKDHLIFYAPGTGKINIIKNTGGTFTSIYSSTTGIGGWDLKNNLDKIIAYDYNSDGRANYLLLTRPYIGMATILQNNSGTFTPVFTSTHGIGGFDMVRQKDQVFAYDYDKSGKQDHLMLYRNEENYVFIVKRSGNTFTPVYASGFGIGGYRFNSWKDSMFPYDYNSTGIANHLFIYRAGDGFVSILENNNGVYTQVY